MIFPVGHEQETVRRWPVVTLAIIALCFFSFLAERHAASSVEQEIHDGAKELLSYYAAHPYLELDKDLVAVLFPATPEQQERLTARLRNLFGKKKPPGPATREREQRELDRLAENLVADIHRRPTWRYGLVPAAFRPLSLLTHLFLHGGWVHLLGNLFFLYLTAPFMEDVWGRLVFALFYLAAGVVAAGLFVAQYPHLQVPLIGASGAIAGVMGAFLIRYGRTRIRFFYFFWLVRFYAGTFWAPAALILPLWFASELISAYAMDRLAPGSGGGGVAHWAHVWGFAFGAVAAVGLGALGVERRHLQKISETSDGELENGVVEQAHEAREEGRPEEAWALLEAEVRANPSNRDAAVALWDLAVASGRAGEAASAFARMVREELVRGESELGLFHWRELRERAPELEPDLPLCLKLAECLAAAGETEEARELLTGGLREAGPQTGDGAVLRLARLAVELEPRFGARVARELLERTAPGPEVAERLQELLLRTADPSEQPGEGWTPSPGPQREERAAPPEPVPVPPARGPERPPGSRRVGAPRGEGAASASPPTEPPSVRPRVRQGIPTALEDGLLLLRMADGGAARLPLSEIAALVVTAIRGGGERPPHLVIDLFLDSPGKGEPRPRVVRLLSRTYDPRDLVAEVEDANRAFRTLVERLLAGSGATPLLGSERFGQGRLTVYPTLQAYESALGKGWS